MIKIIPAILAKTPEEFETMIRAVEPHTDLVHLDIADGAFVPNKTIGGYEELQKINTKLNFEVHLMVNNPEGQIGRWLKTKAIRFLIHWESTAEIDAVINELSTNGKEIGLVFNPQTNWIVSEPYTDRIDLVQFMTVDPGFYGSPFLPEVLEKIKNFQSQYPNKVIQVDGGIKPEIVKLVEAVGVSRAAVGSYIFKSDNIGEALKELTTSNV